MCTRWNMQWTNHIKTKSNVREGVWEKHDERKLVRYIATRCVGVLVQEAKVVPAEVAAEKGVWSRANECGAKSWTRCGQAEQRENRTRECRNQRIKLVEEEERVSTTGE